jgi:DNA-directed RNA polymerase specialized sigma24 family protein
MRDQEFVTAMKKMAPILNKRFHFLVKEAKVRDDKKSLVEDLVSLTILLALENSRKEIHKDMPCERLIRIKARNVWAEYWQQRANSFNHAEHKELRLDWKEDQFSEETSRINELLDNVLDAADTFSAEIINKRREGYEVNEIAKMYDKTPGAITMQIQRLKKKIEKRP